MPDSRQRSRLRRLVEWLYSPEDASGLAVFRILWGGLMAWEAYRYLKAGWVAKYYITAQYNFKYMGFEWVEALPGPGMYIVYYTMMFAGAFVALGLFYRAAAAVFFVAHTYAFLLEAANYLNHAYLIAVLAFVMIWLPAHRSLSIDAWRRKGLACPQIPKWPRAFLLTHLSVVYFYGGVAKINTDWLVYHQPVRRWMAGSAKKVPFFKDLIASEEFTQMVAYGGVAFDLSVAPLLLYRRTRPLIIPIVIGFHLTNSYLFSIGVFPWFMIAATTLFLEPDWLRRLARREVRIARWLGWRWLRGFVTVGVRRLLRVMDRGAAYVVPPLRRRSREVNLMVVWLVVQIALPLRHHFYPGNVAWNEDGHYLSWRMKLRSKKGRVKMRVVDRETGRTWVVDPKEELSKRQARKMAGKPDLIRQYANHLVRRYQEEEGIEVDVYADAFCALNYRHSRRYIDPDKELGHLSASLAPYDWVLRFEWTIPPHPGYEPPPRKKRR